MPNVMIDAAGTTHQRADADARIVSLVPSITELACALGLAPRLVGRTGFCVHPRDTVKPIPKVGGTKDVDVEAVRALAPTHVIVNVDENRRETAEELAAFVPHVIVTHPCAPDDNIALYRLLGGIFDASDVAETLARAYEDARDACRDAVQSWPRQRVLYLIWRDPWMTVSRDTYIARTLALAGLDTVPETAPRRYPEVTLGTAEVQQADAILLSSEPYRFTERHVDELAERFPTTRVALIDGEMTSWYGNRAIDGLRYLPAFRQEARLR